MLGEGNIFSYPMRTKQKSPMEKLEKAIKEVIRDFGTVENNIDARNLWHQIQEKFVALEKACVIVPRNDKELLEKLAELEHRQWAHWIGVQRKFDHSEWERWLKLALTPYVKLTEKEKESDIEWANKVLAVIQQSCVIVPRKQLEEKLGVCVGERAKNCHRLDHILIRELLEEKTK